MRGFILFMLLVFAIQAKTQVSASGPLNISTIADYMVGQYEITSTERSAALTVTFLNGRSNMTDKTQPYKISDWYGYAHITGPSVVCPNTTGITYSINTVTNATTYTWAVPSGWTITSGNGTTTIIATAGAASGNVTVQVGNVSGLSAVNSRWVTTVCPTMASCGSTLTYGTVNAAGHTWLDKNLGATQPAATFDDYSAYGSQFQYTRFGDGHECINWTGSTTGNYVQQTTSVLCSGTNPISPCGISKLFVTSASFYWQVNPINLWTPAPKGSGDPCPTGFRVPSIDEFTALGNTFSPIKNATGAFNSPLKLTMAGCRTYNSGLMQPPLERGLYWTINASMYFQIDNYTAANPYGAIVGGGWGAWVNSAQWPYAMSVRCINQ